jgi:glycerol-3-phosphate dehydrogenase (NAD(P)+)
MATEDIAVIGAGSYGTCLAMLFGNAGHRVSLWCRSPDTATEIDVRRENQGYLPGFKLPSAVTITSDLATAVAGKRFVLGVTPSHGIREVLGAAAPHLHPDAIVINASKGLEADTLATIDQVYRDIFPSRIAARATYLSGPTFANEIAAGLPAAIVLAGTDQQTTQDAQRALSSIRFRIYSSTDVRGVLIAGALKNVIAIGAGVSDGLGLGSNARVAFITRGLAEITRIGVAMGAEPSTFAGLSGMGDLVLTCSGDSSRNRRVGLALGQGKSMAEILGETRMVAEGVKTTRVAHALAQQLGVSAPLTAAMNSVLEGERSAAEAMTMLMQRALRPEKD